MRKELIERIEVGAGGAASIEFTSIPQDGVDLLLVISARTDRAGNTVDGVAVSFNSTNTNESRIQLSGNGSTASSFSGASVRAGLATAADATSNTFGNTSVYVSNYAESQAKSISVDTVGENNATTTFQEIHASLWNDTSAITSIALSPDFGTNFVQHSTASLHKVVNE